MRALLSGPTSMRSSRPLRSATQPRQGRCVPRSPRISRRVSPPEHQDDGLKAALAIRQAHPSLSILVLSQYLGNAYATQLLESGETTDTGCGTGYLLKERVSRVADFVTSAVEVARGNVIIDPLMIRHLITRERQHHALDSLTPREREVLELMAEGLDNGTIARKLFVTEAAIVKHTGNVFTKLGLTQNDGNRRVQAVLAYLSHQ